ncbi:GNAT family N-acetyltransferase [Devosia sp. WQ 349]|uniref:GNAT family N-acetyltransferase n=1 Tax=Devosia sp. WQ 349K1 TaxID=2800329 RepID=UPI00190321F4|nr:GNAT family N-acetyltransferase [Devosia sp. WQ 349K1]MBK1794976.1 GNAT family N-acetyltransferase [Devosia sp. WQ 349K1]
MFQSLGWVRAVWDFEVARNNAAFSPFIVLAYRGESLIGALPMELVSTGMRRVLVPIGYAFSQIANALVAAEEDAETVVRQLIDATKSKIASDTLLFTKVRSGSSLYKGLPADHVKTAETLGAPVAELSDYPDFAAYFRTVRPKTRKNIRNARNRLEREATLSHHVVDDAGQQLALIERTLSSRDQRLKEQGLTSRAFGTRHFQDFCASLVGNPDLSITGFSLVHGQNFLAEQWGFTHGDRYYAYVAARDFSQSDESPGKMHLAEITQACADRGLDACDLGIPTMPYKLTWATQVVGVHDIAIPLTARGKLIVRVWDVWLRPNLKALVLRTPPALRVKVMRFFGRNKDQKP